MDGQYSEIREYIKDENIPRTVFSSTSVAPTKSSHYSTDSEAGASGSYETDVKLSEHADFGIDYSVVTPTFTAAINTVNNPTYAVALANAYNTWCVSEVLDPNENVRGAVVVAPQKPHTAAEEIDRWGEEDSIVGVLLPPTGLYPPPGDERYDPIYQAAQDHDLPILHHSTSNALSHHFPKLTQSLHSYTEGIVLGLSLPIITSYVTTILRGAPERFPKLDFVFQEAGIAWIPWLTWRLDDMYLENFDHHSRLAKLPSAYVEDQFYFTTQPVGHTKSNPEYIAWAIEMAGADSIMYSADLPHSTFDPPSELFNKIHDYFDEETLRGIMGETAIDVFDL